MMGTTASAALPQPALAVCGWSGAGKTTLLETAVASLTARGLAVAAVKHDAHGFEADRAGKDSDRLFRAGASVVLRGPEEMFARRRTTCAPDLASTLRTLLADHDLVLVEGHKDTPLPKIWLLSKGDRVAPGGLNELLGTLPPGAGRTGAFLDLLDEWLPRAWRSVPVIGGLLIGGASARMGRPKALIEHRGRTFAEIIVAALGGAAAPVVALGAGPLPAALAALPRLADPPGPAGPLAGILAALRWWPGAALLAVACDHPLLDGRAVQWLVDQRRPGAWAIMPRDAAHRPSPTLALYEPQVRQFLERLANEPEAGPSRLAGHPRVAHPDPPSALVGAWTDVDRPEDLERL